MIATEYNKLLSPSFDKTLKLWDIPTQTILKQLSISKFANSLECNPIADNFACLFENKKIIFYNWEKGPFYTINVDTYTQTIKWKYKCLEIPPNIGIIHRITLLNSLFQLILVIFKWDIVLRGHIDLTVTNTSFICEILIIIMMNQYDRSECISHN